MHPVFLRLGPIEIRYYSLMYVISFAIGYFLVRSVAKRLGILPKSEDVLDLLLVVIPLGIVFARPIVELARALHAADARPADPSGLAVADPGRLRLRLAPSVTPFASAHPAVAIWAGSTAPAPGASFALVARRPDFALVTEPLTRDDHANLDALAQGAPLGALPHDPGPVLALLMTHGLIAAITPE